MKDSMDEVETGRIALQATLDRDKTQLERNRLGQFATPTPLARDMLAYAWSLLPGNTPVRFLDPAIGTGSFYSALLATAQGRCIASAQGFEIDPHYAKPAKGLWSNTRLEIHLADFTRQVAPTDENQKVNLLICNPPYVRHHHLSVDNKFQLQQAAEKAAHVRLSGLSGLYCYFMAMSHAWMSEGGIAGWLIPSEFMDVNYGRHIKEYLLRDVTLLHIHRFDPNDVQFGDALVSSAVVWFRKEKPNVQHSVVFSYGGSLRSPAISKEFAVRDLRLDEKWTRFPRSDPGEQHEGYRLGDLFAIKRGLATGDNKFFIIDEERVASLRLPREFMRPVLPSPRYLRANEIEADSEGVPLLDKRLFLIDCDLPEEEVRQRYPALWSYLKIGADTVATRYLCQSRRFWYAQERRPAAPIVCTYLGRSDHEGRPFRFLLNHSQATATNVYLMLYPRPLLDRVLSQRPSAMRELWQALNEICDETLLGNGRVYGGGLHKLEPKELSSVPADDLAALVGLGAKPLPRQLELIGIAA